MPVVRVNVSAGGFYGGVPKDVLKHVQRNSGVGKPGRTGVPESVAGQIRQADIDDELIPVGSRRPESERWARR